MNRTTRTALTAGVAVAALITAGCGRGAEPDSAPSGETGQAQAIDDSPATGTIEVWAMGTEGELLSELTDQFEEDNPDADVVVTAVPWSDYLTKIQTAVASGSTPDMTMLGSTALAAVVSAGALSPVPDGLVDTSAFFEGPASGTVLDGVNYAVPWYVETRVQFYRSDLAEQAGLEAPQTWEEATDFYAGLQDSGVDYGITLFTGAPNSYQFVLPYLWQAGAQIISEDGTQWQFDTPEAEEGLAYYASLVADGYAPANGPTNIGEIEPDIVDGEIASIVAGPWEASLLTDAGGQDFYDSQIGVAPMPAGPAGNTSWVGGAHLGVFPDAANPDGAWKLIQWLSEPEVQQQWFDVSGDLPSTVGAWDYEPIDSNPMFTVMREQMEDTATPPAVTTWPEVSAAFDEQIERVAAGVATPAEALAALQDKADSIGTGS